MLAVKSHKRKQSQELLYLKVLEIIVKTMILTSEIRT